MEKADGLRIVQLLSEKLDNHWTVFLGRDKKSCSLRKWKGFLPSVDKYHEYSVLYYEEVDCYGNKSQEDISPSSLKKICAIKKITKSSRVTIRDDVLEMMLSDALAYGTEEAHRMMVRLSSKARAGDLAALLREAGDAEWLQKAERIMPYFADWYADELCPPFRKEAIKHLDGASLAKMVRMAATEPWKLCFWWMTGVPLLEELDMARVEGLAHKFDATIPEDIKFVIQAYSRRPFGDARNRGDSFVWLESLAASNSKERPTLLPKNWLQPCLKYKVAKVVMASETEFVPEKFRRHGREAVVKIEGEEQLVLPRLATCVYALGDLECEAQVAEIITRAVTKIEDETQMRERHKWWPECDSSAPKPNPEQRAAIDAATSQRFAIVHGKPGTGKTALVMKAVVSAFERGQVVGVSFTGMSAQKQKAITRYGTTAHKVVSDWRRLGAESPFAGRKVLVIEEASTMPIRLLHAVLIAMGPSLSRVVMFGDPRQMDPIGGGPSILRELVKRYAGTPIASELKTSMRVSDATGAFVRDLDRICECRINDGFEWSPDPASGSPFVFLRRGKDAKETVKVIRDALKAAGIDPDSPLVQVMVHTNEERTRLMKAWYEASPFAAKHAYVENAFLVGERIMFLENNNSAHKPRDSRLVSDIVMNGTTGIVTKIFDEWPSASEWEPDNPPRTHEVQHTADLRTQGTIRRWIQVKTEDDDILVLLDRYGAQNINRIPPVTTAKMEGQEVKYSVVVLLRVSSELDASEIYTACSRGKERCFVVSDLDASISPECGRCPSRDFATTVMSSKDRFHCTTLWKRFPEYDAIADAIRVKALPVIKDPETIKKDEAAVFDDYSSSSSDGKCVLGKKKHKQRKKSATHFEFPANKKKKKSTKKRRRLTNTC